MHPWTELETDASPTFFDLFVFLISAAPASSFFVCVSRRRGN